MPKPQKYKEFRRLSELESIGDKALSFVFTPNSLRINEKDREKWGVLAYQGNLFLHAFLAFKLAKEFYPVDKLNAEITKRLGNASMATIARAMGMHRAGKAGDYVIGDDELAGILKVLLGICVEEGVISPNIFAKQDFLNKWFIGSSSREASKEAHAVEADTKYPVKSGRAVLPIFTAAVLLSDSESSDAGAGAGRR